MEWLMVDAPPGGSPDGPAPGAASPESLGWKAALGQRLRRLDHLAAFLAVYLCFCGWSLWSYKEQGALVHWEIWYICLGTPACWIGGIVWFSPLPWQWLGKEKASLGLRFLVAAACCVAWLGLLVFQDFVLMAHAGMGLPLSSLMPYTLLILGPVMLLTGYQVDYREKTEWERNQARERAQEAQTRLLQGQLHPHVLFNSLNGLAELIVKDPRLAEESVRSLSDLMRRLLAAGERSSIPLREERTMVEDYLALESLRLGPRLQLEWEWDAALSERPILPLLIQPLVENAIKHGIATVKGGGRLRILAAQEGSALRLEVWNTGQRLPQVRPAGMGIGLANLRERLRLAYGDKASFRLEKREDWTVAAIRIDAAQD